MKYIQYLILIAIASLCFIFIDNVYAAQAYVFIPDNGTGKESLTLNNEVVASQDFYSKYAIFNDMGFSLTTNTNIKDYGRLLSYRLKVDFDTSFLKQYDTVTFMIGRGYGYYNTARSFLVAGAYEEVTPFMDCTAISLPGADDSHQSISFTSFQCHYDASKLTTQKTQLNIIAYSTNDYVVDSSGNVASNTIPFPSTYVSAHLAFFTRDESTVVESIKEQTEAINKQTEATKEQTDTIKDNDTSEAQDSAGGFFSGFNDTDHGGLSSLITAPLSLVQKATDKCSTLNLTMFDKDIPIPCGDELFWNKPEVASFRVIWNCIVGGAALFLILSKVFKVVENLKDPEHDKVEVMKL